ncbi:MAG: MSMEG_4193 family putative phosphomutase [Chloroflexota bacterium]
MITYLLLVRHGENEWVRSNRLAGRTPEVFLNERGRQQSATLAKELAKQPVSAVYSSPLERCVETAQPAAEVLGLPIVIEEGVLEGDFGDWQGQKLKDLAKLPEWKLVQQHPSSFQFPKGESFRAMQFRAVAAIERIQQNHPNEIVVIFSHSDIIRISMAHYLGTPLDLFQRIMISTASVSAIAFHDRKPSVLFVNRTSELPVFELKKDEKPAETNAEQESTA